MKLSVQVQRVNLIFTFYEVCSLKEWLLSFQQVHLEGSEEKGVAEFQPLVGAPAGGRAVVVSFLLVGQIVQT